MKQIVIKYIGFWDSFLPENDFIYRILRKYYDVKISDEAPDYIICSVFGKKYEYCRYPQLRIMYSGENYIPDFNYVDYAISRYPLSFGDRHCCLPGCIDEYGHCEQLQNKDRNYPKSILKSKEFFANFIASHESENGIRGSFFKELSKYKRVESPGTYLNNMPNNETVTWINETKQAFQRKCKFTLCFESTAHYGFVTEKITDAFLADTIPIYYGSPTVKTIFNPRAFVDVSDYSSFDEAIERIIELDNNDDLFMEMLRQPIFQNPSFFSDKMNEVEAFVRHIFDQDINTAYRRSLVFSPKQHEEYIIRKKDHPLDDVSSKEMIHVAISRTLRKLFCCASKLLRRTHRTYGKQ